MEDLITQAVGLIASHGYLIVFVWMFADQVALPLPSAPVLIAAGTVAATGALDVLIVVVVASVATLLADILWYLLGRRGGERAIGLICRMSLEPDSCVTTTRNAFGRFGPGALVVAKFIPGVQTLAPASAGFARAPWPGFLLLDLVGTLLFIMPFIGVGFFFQAQIMELANRLVAISGAATWGVVALASIYLGIKILRWVVFFRGHRLRRLSAEQLNERLESGVPTTIIDLRQRFDYELLPRIIPTARRIPINEIPKRHQEIPREYDIVLVCT